MYIFRRAWLDFDASWLYGYFDGYISFMAIFDALGDFST